MSFSRQIKAVESKICQNEIYTNFSRQNNAVYSRSGKIHEKKQKHWKIRQLKRTQKQNFVKWQLKNQGGESQKISSILDNLRK